MGLVGGVLLLPLAPVRGVAWVAGQIADEAERRLYSPAAVRARLAALNSAFEAGEIDEAAFEAEEDHLLGLLESRSPVMSPTHPSPRTLGMPDG
ncbi:MULTISPECIES: gas vesicle protein GvpG [unclassified Streptomyces]|uniref:gas vesicle protein GvpG n=1 Tax=unclassified Streptomyces TaxID=2593676 RepID=UPI0004C4DAF7|nr:gas vesicle protein GvpG [Streptomyces sp. NRRL F-5630]